MASHYLRKYGVEATVDFELYALDGTGLKTDAASASGDVTLYRDEAAVETLDADAFVDEGAIYSLVISAAEMAASRIIVCIVDQTSPQAWLDKTLIIETYGNASAQHAFDLGEATQDVNLTKIGGDTQSATDLKDFADAGYDPATDKITGVKLCDRTTLVDGVTLCDQTTLVDNVTLCDETTLVDTTTTNTDMVADVASDVTDIKAKTDLIGASVALETGGKIAGIETTLASPDNFKANVTNLDAAVSTRAPSGEYDTEVAHLDADISSRAPTSEYDTEMAHLDADITSRAPAGEYDTELDTTISSRAPASEYDTEMARITANVATETKQDTNATHLTDIKGGTFNGATDSLEAIRNRGDSAWISATTVDLNADQSAVTIGTVNTALALTANNDKTGYALAAAGIDGIWDEVIEGTLTGRQVLRLNLSALTGKSSGGGTATLIFRDNGDTKARITATVDEDGNRTAMTLDET